jgi:ribosomal-protein-alanine N-acetyltransferase
MIQNQRVNIIPFRRRFIESKYINWLNDPDVTRFSNQRVYVQMKTSCLDYLDSYRNSENMLWAIVETHEGHGHIGNINAIIDRTSPITDIGIVIGEKSCGVKVMG